MKVVKLIVASCLPVKPWWINNESKNGDISIVNAYQVFSFLNAQTESKQMKHFDWEQTEEHPTQMYTVLWNEFAATTAVSPLSVLAVSSGEEWWSSSHWSFTYVWFTEDDRQRWAFLGRLGCVQWYDILRLFLVTRGMQPWYFSWEHYEMRVWKRRDLKRKFIFVQFHCNHVSMRGFVDGVRRLNARNSDANEPTSGSTSQFLH